MTAKTEAQIMREVHSKTGSLPNVRMVRNNLGLAWVARGKPERTQGGVFLPGGVQYHFGLPPGSSDLIGIKKVHITPDMVGQDLGVLVSIEIKTPRGRVAENQNDWLKMVTDFGGIGGVARSVEDAYKIIGH